MSTTPEGLGKEEGLALAIACRRLGLEEIAGNFAIHRSAAHFGYRVVIFDEGVTPEFGKPPAEEVSFQEVLIGDADIRREEGR